MVRFGVVKHGKYGQRVVFKSLKVNAVIGKARKLSIRRKGVLFETVKIVSDNTIASMGFFENGLAVQMPEYPNTRKSSGGYVRGVVLAYRELLGALFDCRERFL